MAKIRVNMSDVVKKIHGMENFRKIVPKALSNAERTMKKETREQVSKRYKVNKTAVSKASKYKKSFFPIELSMTTRSERYTLGRFAQGRRTKPTVQVRKGANTGIDFYTYIGKDRQVIRRRGEERLPIDVYRTLSPSNMVRERKVSRPILKETRKVFMDELSRLYIALKV